MSLLLLQVPPPPPGVDPLTGWLIAVVFGAFTTAIGVLWRQAVAESKRKDELIDRLLEAEHQNADTNQKSVSLLTEERRRQR
jgi:hypothetical protein